MVRWTPGVGKVFVCLAALLCIAPSAASAVTTSERFGGADRTINADSEVLALLSDSTTTEAVITALPATEQTFVIDRGLTATDVEYAPEAETPAATPPVTETSEGVDSTGCNLRDYPDCRSVPRVFRRISQWSCVEKSAVGVHLFRIHSRWNYTYDGYKVKSASHAEWITIGAPFWHYDGTSYLWKTGAVGTSVVGRAVQGRAYFQFGLIHRARDRIIDVHVYASGSPAYVSCTG